MVVIDDVQDRFRENDEFNVLMKYNRESNTFEIRLPEAKPLVPREDKPKPENLFTGMFSGIKGTITAKGNAKVNMDIPPAKVKALGHETLWNDLKTAFNVVYERAVDPSSASPKGGTECN